MRNPHRQQVLPDREGGNMSIENVEIDVASICNSQSSDEIITILIKDGKLYRYTYDDTGENTRKFRYAEVYDEIKKEFTDISHKKVGT